jgi:TRAP-type C4-dicarboxylate transport system substrate-binding protein
MVEMGNNWAHPQAGRFPITEMFWLPFLGGASAAVYSVAAWDFTFHDPLAQPIRDEYKNVKLQSIHSSAVQNLHTITKLITSLDDIKGEIIAGENLTQLTSIENWGGVPTLVQMPDSALAAEKGVIEGGIWPWAPLRSFGTAVFLNYHTILDFNYSIDFPSMNKEFWEALPTDLQDCFDEWMNGMNYAHFVGAALDNGSEVDLEWFEAKGDQFYTPNPDEKATWFEGASENYEVWYQQAVDNGVSYEQAQQMVARFRDYVAKWNLEIPEEPEWFEYAGRYGSPRRPGGWD